MDVEHQTQASRRRHTRGHLALCSCAGGPRPCPAMANSALEERRLFLHADPAAVSGSLQRHVLTLRTQAGRCIICWLRSDEFAPMACMLSGEQYTPCHRLFAPLTSVARIRATRVQKSPVPFFPPFGLRPDVHRGHARGLRYDMHADHRVPATSRNGVEERPCTCIYPRRRPHRFLFSSRELQSVRLCQKSTR